MIRKLCALVSIVMVGAFSAFAATTLSGLVRDASSLGYIDATLVLLSGTTPVDTLVAAGGIYSFSSVDAGTYTLHVYSPGYATRDSSVTVAADPVSVIIKLEPMGTNAIAGIVTDSLTGLPVNNVLISFQQGTSRKDTTGSDGQYFFDNVVVGSYNFLCTVSGYVTKTVKVGALAAGTVIIPIQLVPIKHLNLSGTITDTSAGTPINHAIVTLKIGGTIRRDTTAADGIYSFDSVTTGIYTITAIDTPSHAIKSASFYSVGTTAKTVDFQLPLSQISVVQGIVTDSVTTLPLVGAIVKLRQGPLTLKTDTTGTDGAYSFAGVITGDYNVQVSESLYTARAVLVTTRGTAPIIVDIYLNLAPVYAVKLPQRASALVGPQFRMAGAVVRLANIKDAGVLTIRGLNGKLMCRRSFTAHCSEIVLPGSIANSRGVYVLSITQRNGVYRKQIVLP
jgi:large repetitive protein